MGYTRHNAIVVTALGFFMRGKGDIPAPDVEAFRSSLPPAWQALIVGPVPSVVEDYQSFAFLPDGSKEGWEDSDRGDEYRQQFIDLFSVTGADGFTYTDVLVLDARFGGDEPEAGYEPVLTVAANPHVTACGD